MRSVHLCGFGQCQRQCGCSFLPGHNHCSIFKQSDYPIAWKVITINVALFLKTGKETYIEVARQRVLPVRLKAPKTNLTRCQKEAKGSDNRLLVGKLFTNMNDILGF